MMLAESVAAGALWRGDVAVGRIHFGVHTMLYAAIVVIAGYQTVTFGVFTKVLPVWRAFCPRTGASTGSSGM